MVVGLTALVVTLAVAVATPTTATNTTATCDLCLTVTRTVASALLANATQAEATAELDKVCAHLPHGAVALCDSLAAAIDSSLWGFAHETSFPAVVCGEIGVCAFSCCAEDRVEQVHLALAAEADAMTVSWATLGAGPSVVRYGPAPDALTANATGDSDTYTFGGWRGWLHAATMRSLPTPGAVVYYQVGDGGQVWSDVFHFRAPPALDAPFGVHVLFIGDMGVHNSAATMAALEAEVASGGYDLLVHNGDISYADGQQPLWDAFMARIQPFAAFIPVMVTPGNHDCPGRFRAFTKRFQMPQGYGGEAPYYYGFDYRHIHFTMFATDYPNDDPVWPDGTAAFKPGTPQHSWIVGDVAGFASGRGAKLRADGIEPWLVVAGHRPFYCSSASNGDWADCLGHAPMYRDWLEDDMHAAHVDLNLQSHEHAYERTAPVFHGNVGSGAVYVVNGAGGNIEGHAPQYQDPPPSWSKFRDGTEYGYSRMWFGPPGKHASLFFEFVGVEGGGVVDAWWLNKSLTG